MSLNDSVNVNEVSAWAVVIFASRESVATLGDCLRATIEAARYSGQRVTIDVLVNGNSALVALLQSTYADFFGEYESLRVRLWGLTLGDKANSWNQYIHSIWSGEECAFFVDGYVRLLPDALARLGNSMQENSAALAGTGIPSIGNTAGKLKKQMISEGGFHGNFCCFSAAAMQSMKKNSVRIPVGLYRTDGFIGALACLAFMPLGQQWNQARIHVDPYASWLTDEKKLTNVSDVSSYIKRRVRQAQGKVETKAIQELLLRKRAKPEFFPSTAYQLVFDWIATNKLAYLALALKSPLVFYATIKLKTKGRVSLDELGANKVLPKSL